MTLIFAAEVTQKQRRCKLKQQVHGLGEEKIVFLEETLVGGGGEEQQTCHQP